MHYGIRRTDSYGESGTLWLLLRRSNYRTGADAREVIRTAIHPRTWGAYGYSAPLIRRVGDRILIKQTFQRL